MPPTFMLALALCSEPKRTGFHFVQMPRHTEDLSQDVCKDMGGQGGTDSITWMLRARCTL